jgi:hypothetical protein
MKGFVLGVRVEVVYSTVNFNNRDAIFHGTKKHTEAFVVAIVLFIRRLRGLRSEMSWYVPISIYREVPRHSIPQPPALGFASTPQCNAEKSDHLQSCDEAADQTASPRALPQRQPCSKCQPHGESVREMQSCVKLGRGTKCTSETAEGT